MYAQLFTYVQIEYSNIKTLCGHNYDSTGE